MVVCMDICLCEWKCGWVRGCGWVWLCVGMIVCVCVCVQAKALELERVSGAYWRGDEKRAMLQVCV